MLRTDELPMLAARWLADHDSESLVRLAGLDGSEGWLIDQLWPEVLADLGVEAAASQESLWNRAVAWQVAAWRAGDRNLEDIATVVLRAAHDEGFPDAAWGGGHLSGLEVELVGGWGRPQEQVWRDIQSLLEGWADRTAGE